MSRRRKSNKTPKWVPFIFLIIGLVFSAVAIGVGYSNWQFEERAHTTEGMVVKMVGQKSSKAPVVRFRLPNGEAVTFQSSLRSNPPRYTVEDKVTVRYDPENPQSAAIIGWLEQWMLVTIMGSFGVFFTGVGVALLFKLF